MAPVSQHNCTFCHQALPEDDFLACHICPSCGKPQGLSLVKEQRPNYFEVFGVRKRFAIDLKDLETRFYKLSRALHPDRFTTSDAESKRNSLERMGLVNQAYQTLKNPADLRDYILEIEGLNAEKKKAQIPMELAESWFELQDLISDPDGAQSADIDNKLDSFLVELRQIKERGEQEIRGLEKTLDQGFTQENLEKLGAKIQAQSYLSSLERDVAKKRKEKET